MREKSVLTGGRAGTERRLFVFLWPFGLFVLMAVGGCTSYYEVPIEVPIEAKLDVTEYNRVLVASFTTQTNERPPRPG